jgi:hypothetical protein
MIRYLPTAALLVLTLWTPLAWVPAVLTALVALERAVVERYP